jgi:predicted AlkP superfamily phosphohydrolase/phosphomutase/tetratricopeptide (TPR) repeat protein
MTTKRKVLLVGWDGADWDHITPMMDAGKLPVLESLVNRGVMGNIATLQPVLSPMLWNSIATGKEAWKHGVHGFVEPDPRGRGARPWSSSTRKTKALWNILSQRGLTSNIINWWASFPAEPIRGCVISNLIHGSKKPQLNDHVVHPETLSEELAELVVEATELGGEQLLPFVPQGGNVDQDSDARLSTLAKHLAEMLTTHNAATHVMAENEWDFTAVYYTAIDHFCHTFMPYFPPRLPWIDEDDFEMYQHVIEGIYRFSDMTLGRLIELSGDDTTVIVCSDHGFESGSQRLMLTPNEPAGPAHWHRKYGIFVAAGPGIRSDSRIYGASLLDVAPTILHMFGLPVGEDMDGRVLDEIFVEPRVIERIESWDAVQSAESGIVDAAFAMPEKASNDLMKQFAALGYIDDLGESTAEQFEFATTEAAYNLAINLAWSGQHVEAAERLLTLVDKYPWENRFLLNLARTFITSGHAQQARDLLESCFDLEQTRNNSALAVWAETLLSLKDAAGSIEALKRLRQRRPKTPGPYLQMGRCYLRLDDYGSALSTYQSAWGLDHENAETHFGLASSYLGLRDFESAAYHALESVTLLYNRWRGHLVLGISLMQLKHYERAAFALSVAARIAPDQPRPLRWLSLLYAGPLNDSNTSDEHVARFEQARHKAWLRTQQSKSETPTKVFVNRDWSAIPNESERQSLLQKNRPIPVSQSKPSGKTFVLVSGLPRSGTSLMMQMLEKGGLPPKTDSERAADQDNPKGYFEWEAIKKLASQPQLFDEQGLDQKSIKVVAPLLPLLPYRHNYKVIFMDRPVDEVVASQAKMTDRLGTQGADWSDETLAKELHRYRQLSLAWLAGHPRAELLVVNYPSLLESPASHIDSISEFIGAELLPLKDSMGTAIDATLYRNRS